MQRETDFEVRRKHLADLSEVDLDARFWELANQIVAPLVELAAGHTSPSIERSVLLRMGLDSISAVGLVKRIDELGLLGHGAGHVLWRLAQGEKIDIAAAGDLLMTDSGGDKARELFLRKEAVRQ